MNHKMGNIEINEHESRQQDNDMSNNYLRKESLRDENMCGCNNNKHLCIKFARIAQCVCMSLSIPLRSYTQDCSQSVCVYIDR